MDFRGPKDSIKEIKVDNHEVKSESSENVEAVKGERESGRWGSEKKEPMKEKERLNEKGKDHFKRELWSSTAKEVSHNEKELVDISGKSVEQENLGIEPKKKDQDTWKNVGGEARDRKKERETDVEPERPDKRSRYCEFDEGGMLAEGGVERPMRMLRPMSSPQMGSNPRHRACSNDTEGSNGKGDVSCVAYKTGEFVQELVKLWNEYKLLQADKACEGSQNGPTLEIRISAEHINATNHQVRSGQLWGTDVYTVDSDLVAVLMHTGYCRPDASPPPATEELRVIIRVLPPQDCYISTLRNNVRSHSWGVAVDCSYRVERCCIVKKGGEIIDLEPCLTHSATMEPTLAPMAVERKMTTRAAALNALYQQRFVREVTIQFNLCMEPWLKYSISAVADKGLKKSLFSSARLKRGEVLYVETRFCRYELCFNGEKYGMDGDAMGVDVFRWSRCKRHLPQKIMRNVGIPLPLEHVETLEDNLEWDDISWSQTGAWIGGKEYHLYRAHFLSPN